MDVGIVAQAARDLTTEKCLLISTFVLTLYDQLLTLNDEIQYVWKARKSWIFYLYITNRILLSVYQLWEIYYITNPRNSTTMCLAGYYFRVSLIMLFLFSSDIFIILRIYAITLKNKALAVYFATLSLARLSLSLASAFANTPSITTFSPIPVNAFNLCRIIVKPKFKFIPSIIGSVFELSAFSVIVWCTYKGALRFSTLVQMIIAEATVHFLAMIAVQAYVQLSLSLMEDTNQQLSFFAYGLLNPILAMRFAVSLKRAVDPEGEQAWQVKHFTSLNFAPHPSRNTHVSGVSGGIELDTVSPLVQPQQTGKP